MFWWKFVGDTKVAKAGRQAWVINHTGLQLHKSKSPDWLPVIYKYYHNTSFYIRCTRFRYTFIHFLVWRPRPMHWSRYTPWFQDYQTLDWSIGRMNWRVRHWRWRSIRGRISDTLFTPSKHPLCRRITYDIIATKFTHKCLINISRSTGWSVGGISTWYAFQCNGWVPIPYFSVHCLTEKGIVNA
jgi:hypothetical protein